MKKLNEWEENISKWIKKYIACISAFVFFGCLVYFMLLSQNLVNSMDGLWWNSNFIAGHWELSIGRWFWPFLDELRFGVVSYPFNSILTFILDGIAIALLIDLFGVKNKRIMFLMGAMFLASPMTCDVLSYSYMSPTFGMAFLLSVMAACCVIKTSNPVAAVLRGGYCSHAQWEAIRHILVLHVRYCCSF